MTAISLAVEQLKVDEGFRSDCYDDGNGAPIITNGSPTVGYGCRCKQWPKDLAEVVLKYQVTQIYGQLYEQKWFMDADSTRQAALLNIAFNVGVSGLLTGFPKMIAAIQAGDWIAASQECHVKPPSIDVGRYARLRQMLLLGGGE